MGHIRDCIARVTKYKSEDQIIRFKGSFTSGPVWRKLGTERCERGESGLGREHVFGRHGEGFKTSEVKFSALIALAPKRKGGQEIEPCAKPELCDMKAITEARREIIPVQKDVGSLLQPVFKAEIGVIKALGHGHLAFAPRKLGWLVHLGLIR